MKKRTCCLFVFNGFADWEPSLVTSGLNKYSDFEIRTFSVDGKMVRSMGNLEINPEFNLHQMNTTDFQMLLLPGGDAWEEGANIEIKELVLAAFDAGKLIAAICAATTFLARNGIFESVKHTSNGLEYLKKKVSEYSADKNYVAQPAVTDKNVITANGAAMIEFAHEIFSYYNLFKQEELQYWLTLYKSAGMSLADRT
jgi:putative intracellular protease/amidase